MTSPHSLWHGLFPPSVVVESGDPAELSLELFADEAVLVAGAAEKRQREFAMGRRCARRALARLGLAPTPLLAGRSGEPLWPDGVLGSITHTARLCAAAVARGDGLVGIGIDAEQDAELPPDIVPCVCRPEEIAAFETCAFIGLANATMVAFSAKEAVFKCQYPTRRRMLEFHDLSLTLIADGTFTVRWLNGDDASCLLFGRWNRRGGFVLSTAWIES
jgi:4'-phosphopantetheinyl transferase EntD